MPIYSDAGAKSDDFMFAVESSSPQMTSLPNPNSNSMEPDENDIYVLLAQKERDLLLAAEIGQALLEKNEELSKQNEKIAEDFSKKLEVRSVYTFNEIKSNIISFCYPVGYKTCYQAKNLLLSFLIKSPH